MFVSVGSIIGSGWLFGALYASQQAGRAALPSWGIGAVFMLTLALIHAELGGAYPIAGGTARYPHYSHGSTVGYTIGWLWWPVRRRSPRSRSRRRSNTSRTTSRGSRRVPYGPGFRGKRTTRRLPTCHHRVA
jgi:Amino acid permease